MSESVKDAAKHGARTGLTVFALIWVGFGAAALADRIGWTTVLISALAVLCVGLACWITRR